MTQDLVVTEDDCGTSNGVAMKALIEGGEVIEALRDRILGRVVTVDVVHPETQETLFESGTLLDEDRSTRSSAWASTRCACARRSPARPATGCARSATAATWAAACW